MNLQRKKGYFLLLCVLLCTCMLVSCLHLTEMDFPLLQETDRTDDDTTDSTEKPSDTTVDTTDDENDTRPPEQGSETTTSAVTDRETSAPTAETTTRAPETTTPEPETTTPSPESTTAPQQPTTPPESVDKKIKIYIDQGHNPFSPTHPPSWNTGASGNGLQEADLTYEIGILLAELLSKDERFEVRLSRPTPETILGVYNGSVSEANDSALDARVNDANAWGADYFISLHINSYTSASANGLEVYYTANDTAGKALSEDLLQGLLDTTQLRNRGVKNGDHLRVLKNTTMPSALVEMGFISNADDAALLDNSPNLFAKGLYNGIVSYFENLEKETVKE